MLNLKAVYQLLEKVDFGNHRSTQNPKVLEASLLLFSCQAVKYKRGTMAALYYQTKLRHEEEITCTSVRKGVLKDQFFAQIPWVKLLKSRHCGYGSLPYAVCWVLTAYLKTLKPKGFRMSLEAVIWRGQLYLCGRHRTHTNVCWIPCLFSDKELIKLSLRKLLGKLMISWRRVIVV